MSLESLGDLLRFVLASPLELNEIASLEAWQAGHVGRLEVAARPFDRAVVAGFSADRLGYAFAGGYQAALAALVPELARELVSLVATERGGGHPRAIETTLTDQKDGTFVVRGSKRWATLSRQADALLVVAKAGVRDGRNELKVVRVDRRAPSVSITPMPDTPFAPEIPHAEIAFDDVRIDATAVLPGDGYERYLKPFRTIEDTHVLGASFGHAIRLARMASVPELATEACALITTLRSIALEPPLAPETHAALAGVFRFVHGHLERLAPALARSHPAVHARLERDLPLLAVATSARAKRAESAFRALGLRD